MADIAPEKDEDNCEQNKNKRRKQASFLTNIIIIMTINIYYKTEKRAKQQCKG
jgi:hypothetical protein